MDKLTRERRSWNMSRIRAKNTKPELFLRSMLHRAGYRFRIHVRKLPGTPDIVLPRYRTAVFIHGCFWHGHGGCRDFAPPKTRTDWWLEKISKNKEKDAENSAELAKLGWHVVTVWECELQRNGGGKRVEALVRELKKRYGEF